MEKKVERYCYSCEIGRLDCWGVDYYNTKKEAKELGWTEKNGKTRCPSCSHREDKFSENHRKQNDG